MIKKSSIETDIPIPKLNRGTHRYDDLLVMSIGDSILFSVNEYKAARNAADKAMKITERRFTWRRVENGYRCWRVA